MTARIWNDSGWIKETDPTILKLLFDKALRDSGFKVIDVLEHHFTPQGYTALYLLSESHFAIHTFPEFGKTYYEISSCNKEYFIHLLEIIDEQEVA